MLKIQTQLTVSWNLATFSFVAISLTNVATLNSIFITLKSTIPCTKEMNIKNMPLLFQDNILMNLRYKMDIVKKNNIWIWDINYTEYLKLKEYTQWKKCIEYFNIENVTDDNNTYRNSFNKYNIELKLKWF